MHALLETARLLALQAGQVDPSLGAPAAQRGAASRMTDPTAYDVVFPIIAFVLVILVPAAVAVWALVKTVRDPTPDPGER